MRKVLKWIGIILGVVIGLLLIAVAAVYGISTYRFNRIYDVQWKAVEIPTDQASIEYGKHIAPSAAVWPTMVMIWQVRSNSKT